MLSNRCTLDYSFCVYSVPSVGYIQIIIIIIKRRLYFVLFESFGRSIGDVMPSPSTHFGVYAQEEGKPNYSGTSYNNNFLLLQ